MFLYTWIEAVTSSFANTSGKNKRGFYAAFYAGMADRELDMCLDKDKAAGMLNVFGLGEKFSQAVVKILHDEVKLGLKDTFFTEVHLGYGLRIRDIWLGVDGFLLYEPRNILDFTISTSMETSEYKINITNVLVGGVNINMGYYITQSTALLLALGFEFGSQGNFENKAESGNTLIDGGIRMGVETKIDITEKTSLKFGYQYCIISKSISSKLLPLNKISLYKHRVFGGIQYHFNG